MDPVIAPFALLFLGTLGLDLGLFTKDDTPEDAAPTDTESGLPIDAPAEEPGVADPDNFDADLYSDVVNGTEGDDSLSAGEESALAWFLDDGNDTLDGSDGNDYAQGGAGDDTMTLRGGRDLAYGGDGDDVIDGGIGFDTVFGGAGEDTLSGNGGNDLLYGDDDDDILSGGSGSDLLFGGAGNDTLYGMSTGLSTPDGNSAIDGVDTLVGGAGDDRLILGPGDIGTGGEGDDVFEIDHSRTDLTNVSQINDFSPGDSLEISYVQTFDSLGDPEQPEITIERNDADDGEHVLFNSVVIANVIGAQGLMPGDITLNPAIR